MNDNDFNAFLSELQDLEKSKDYAIIADQFDSRFDRDVNNSFDSKTNGIINKWIESKVALSKEEKQYLNLLSNIELSFVRYYLSIHNKRTNDLNFNDKKENDSQIIGKVSKRLLRTKQINDLKVAVIFIRNNRESNNEDEMVSYITRMIDARALACRICLTDVHGSQNPSIVHLKEELYECLNDRQAIHCLDEVIFPDKTKKNISINRHRFFLGCCTFAMALIKTEKTFTINNQYIYRLAKYVREVLQQRNFAEDDLIIYYLRGILAFLTNCIPTEYWLDIINKALLNKDDDDAQRKNPFNIDLFSSIINKLLGSDILCDNSRKNDTNNEVLLVDIALVFLHNWCYTSGNPNDDDDDDNLNKINNSLSSTIPNQVVQFLRTDSDRNENKDKTQIILPYIDENYDDRIRLMAFSTLANVMSYEAREKLKESYPTMAKDLVKIIFDFIQRAETSPDRRYRGVPFQRLLRNLLQFLDQDFVKKETIPYISNIVGYAKQSEFYALRILRKISSCPKLQSDLLNNEILKVFLDEDENKLISRNPKKEEIIKQIRLNFVPEEISIPINDNKRQIFISYSHKNKDKCNLIEQEFNKHEPLIKIWIDKYFMKDKINQTVAGAISESQVVLVLLSEPYIASDPCRREWSFAMNKEIKVFHIIVQDNFPRKKYDWVVYNLSDDYCYMIHKAGELNRLIEHVSDYYNTQQRPKIGKIQDEPVPTVTLTKKIIRTGNSVYLQKTSVTEWTSADIQDWCFDNKLDKWTELLSDYDGDALLELRRVLTIDSHFQHFATINRFNMIDVTLLKSKLDKVISPSAITQKKDINKRRASKSSVK